MTAELPGRPHATARTPRSGPFVVATIGFVASEVFVGRRPEVAVLHDLLAGVKAGVGGVVLVAGWSAPDFPDSGFVVNSRCGLPFHVLIADLLRGPVLKSGVATF